MAKPNLREQADDDDASASAWEGDDMRLRQPVRTISATLDSLAALALNAATHWK